MPKNYKDSVLLIDVHAVAHRSYNALPPLSREDGHPTNASYGFLRALFSVLKARQYTHIVACYDAGGGNFRKEIDNEYKGNRGSLSEDLKVQIQDILEILPELGIPTMGLPGAEADDILFTISDSFYGGQKPYFTVLTCDRDLLGSLGENVDVLLFNTSPKKMRRVTQESLAEEKGDDYLEFFLYIKAIVGDGSDNIKGIKGIGEKTAIKYLVECGIDAISIYDHPKLAPHSNLIRKNLELVTPRRIELFSGLDPDVEFTVRHPDFEQFKKVMDEYGFRSFTSTFNYHKILCDVKPNR